SRPGAAGSASPIELRDQNPLRRFPLFHRSPAARRGAAAPSSTAQTKHSVPDNQRSSTPPGQAHPNIQLVQQFYPLSDDLRRGIVTHSTYCKGHLRPPARSDGPPAGSSTLPFTQASEA